MARSIHVRRGIMAWQIFKSRKTTVQMLKEVLRGQYKMSLLTIFILVLGGIYIISPIDLIPDWFWIIGWTDDAVVLYFVLKRLQSETQRYIRFKAAERRKGL